MSKLREGKMMEKNPLIIVGAGMASPRPVEKLVARAPGGYALRLTAENRRPPYNPAVSSVPANEIAVSVIGQWATAWRRAAGVKVLADATIGAIRRSLMSDAPLRLEAA
jgi:NAD(P)H-nitrite reductase large subunit